MNSTLINVVDKVLLKKFFSSLISHFPLMSQIVVKKCRIIDVNQGDKSRHLVPILLMDPAMKMFGVINKWRHEKFQTYVRGKWLVGNNVDLCKVCSDRSTFFWNWMTSQNCLPPSQERRDVIEDSNNASLCKSLKKTFHAKMFQINFVKKKIRDLFSQSLGK